MMDKEDRKKGYYNNDHHHISSLWPLAIITSIDKCKVIIGHHVHYINKIVQQFSPLGYQPSTLLPLFGSEHQKQEKTKSHITRMERDQRIEMPD
jgi:hypothetical protein